MGTERLRHGPVERPGGGRGRRSVDLTVAMCFLNERDEVRRTVESVRDTAGDHVDILLVNDCSTPDYDYRAVAREFDCGYVENPMRCGPAICRNFMADAAQTSQLLLVDAHVRFYDGAWCEAIVDAVSTNRRAIYGTRSIPLRPDASPGEGGAGLGAWLGLAPDETHTQPADRAWSVLEPHWNVVRRSAGPFETVPLVLGGAYAFDRSFFREIGGLLGLRMYGSDEAYLSIKAWRAGGSCRVLTDVTVGHIYRAGDWMPPFVTPPDFFVYNKLALLGLVFPHARFEQYRGWMEPMPVYREAVAIFRREQMLIDRLRRYLHGQVFRRPFEFFEQLNEAFRGGADISHNAEGGQDEPAASRQRF